MRARRIILACATVAVLIALRCQCRGPGASAVTQIAELDVTTSATFTGTFVGTTSPTFQNNGGTRLTLKSTLLGNNGSTVRWRNSANAALFSMGPDFDGNATNDWFLFDNVNGLTNIRINNLATSFLSFGTSSGGMQYDESTDTLGLFAGGTVSWSVTDTSGLPYITVGVGTYYIGALPTVGSDCNGSGSASIDADSNNSRGSIRLGTGSTACTLTFNPPWDVGVSLGKPICGAWSSVSPNTIAVTAITDHLVTFTPSASGVQTLYYFCDGILP